MPPRSWLLDEAESRSVVTTDAWRDRVALTAYCVQLLSVACGAHLPRPNQLIASDAARGRAVLADCAVATLELQDLHTGAMQC